MRRWMGLVFVLAMGGGACARGADPRVPACWAAGKPIGAYLPTTATAETSRLLLEMAAQDFAVRERATRELIDMGVDAFPGILEALRKSDSPEAKARLEKILGREEDESRVSTATANAMGRYDAYRQSILDHPIGRDPLDIVVSGFLQGSREKEVLFLKSALAKETAPGLLDLLNWEMEGLAGTRARLAIATGQFDEARRILIDALPTVQESWSDYAALAAIVNGKEFNPEKELEALRGKLGGSLGEKQMGMLLYRAKGDTKRAAEFARGLPAANWYAPRTPLIEAREFEAIGADIQHLPFDQPLAKLVASGDRNCVKEFLDEALRGLESRKTGEEALFPLMLFQVSGRLDEAVAALNKIPDDQDCAFHILCQQLRVREALATIRDRQNVRLAIPEHLIDLGLTAPARDLLRGMAHGALGKSKLGRECIANDEFEYSATLRRIGLVNEADDWQRRAFRTIEEDEARLAPVQKALRAKQMQLHIGVGAQRDAIREEEDLSRQLQALVKTSRSVNLSLQSLFPNYQAYSEMVYWNNLIRDEGLGAEARFRKTVRIMEGHINESEAGSLIAKVVNQSMAGSAYVSELQYAVDAFHRASRDDWVIDVISRWYEREGDPICWALAGDIALEEGKPEMAFVYYRRAAPTNWTNGSLMYRMGLALQRGKVARQMGQELIDFAPLLVLGDRSASYELAQAMSRFEGEKAGESYLDGAMAKFGRQTIWENGDRFDHMARAAEVKGDYTELLELQKKMLFALPGRVQGKSWPTEPMRVVAEYERARALEAWFRKDAGTVVDGLWREMDNGPPDVEVMEKVVPWLLGVDRAGAQKVIGRAEGRLAEVVADYPEMEKYRGELERVRKLGK